MAYQAIEYPLPITDSDEYMLTAAFETIARLLTHGYKVEFTQTYERDGRLYGMAYLYKKDELEVDVTLPSRYMHFYHAQGTNNLTDAYSWHKIVVDKE